MNTVHMPNPAVLGRFRFGPRRREAGITLMEALAVIAGLGIMIAFAVPRIQGMFASTRAEQSYTELVDVVIAGQKYRQINGDYDDLDNMQVLVDNGYILSGYTDGAGENAYGLNVTIASANSDANAEITYQFDEEQACEQLEKRVAKIKAVSNTPACSGSGPYTLTFQVN